MYITLLILLCQKGKQALFRAANAGDIDAVKRHLRGHTSINSQDEVCKNFCIFETSIEFLSFVYQDGRTALFHAAWKGHINVVNLLVKAHADLNLPEKVYNTS